MVEAEIRHFHLFCGLGGGAAGFNDGEARVGQMQARFRCIGGVDVDAGAIANFERMAHARGTVMDLFDRAQYRAFFGKEPPEGWREVTPADIRVAAGNERPHIIFTSPPCKGFSGLLAEGKSKSEKYQALNALTVRGVWLALEAWKDDPPEFFLLENVPRILTRGRALLDRIGQLLRHYGYAVAETTHDCGELGGLAQSRKRFLLVARHTEKVPTFLYQPARKPLQAVGDVLGKLPMPGHAAVGPMHRLPQLQWRTWVRLAFVEAGKDWRSLNRLAVRDGFLRDYAIAPDAGYHAGAYGVQRWEEHAGVVTGNGRPACGAFSIADPRRAEGRAEFGQYGVKRWEEVGPTVTGKAAAGAGPFTIADPRIAGEPRYNSAYRVVRFDGPSPAVAGPGGPANGLAVADPRRALYSNGNGVLKWEETAGAIAGESLPSNGRFAVADPRGYGESTHAHALKVTEWEKHGGTVTASRSPGSGALCVADPRPVDHPSYKQNKYKVTEYDAPAGAVIGASSTGNGAFAVADPRPPVLQTGRGEHYETAGHYGVVPWNEPTGVVAASTRHDAGYGNVADPRLPGPDDRLTCLIVAEDNTWHRPFTTFELGALQSLFDVEEYLGFAPGVTYKSDSQLREWVGNAVPRHAARAMAGVFGQCLLLAWSGETFLLSEHPIWVRPLVAAIQCGAA